jgi:hypothetical protein
MMKMRTPLLALIVALSAATAVVAQDLRSTLFAEADEAQKAARDAEAPLLAPDSFEHGLDAYQDADNDLQRGRNLQRIRNKLAEATKAFNDSAQAAEIAKITLASLIKTRDDATNAHAESFASEAWTRAEELFEGAARRLESGDIRGSRSRASEAEELYRDAELTAIKAQYLSQTRALLAQADQARVPRYAPKTFAKAQDLLAQAEHELNENRYDTDLPRSLAQQANYEARHAIDVAKRVRMMRDEDWTLEDVILAYEDPISQIAAAADQAAQLDHGVDPVAQDLVSFIAPRGRLPGTRRASPEAGSGSTNSRAILDDRKAVLPRRGENFSGRQYTDIAARRPDVRKRKSRHQARSTAIARESVSSIGRVPAIPNRYRRPYRLVWQRRYQSGPVAAPRPSGQGLLVQPVRCRCVSNQRRRLRRDPPYRKQRDGPRTCAKQKNRRSHRATDRVRGSSVQRPTEPSSNHAPMLSATSG